MYYNLFIFKINSLSNRIWFWYKICTVDFVLIKFLFKLVSTYGLLDIEGQEKVYLNPTDILSKRWLFYISYIVTLLLTPISLFQNVQEWPENLTSETFFVRRYVQSDGTLVVRYSPHVISITLSLLICPDGTPYIYLFGGELRSESTTDQCCIHYGVRYWQVNSDS